MPEETPKEIVDKVLSAIKLAKQDGIIRKGVNEVTKDLERGLATLVVVANDVSPKEVVMHLPGLCEQHKTPIVYVPAKIDLGKAAGLNVQCSSVAIEKAGSASAVLKEIMTWYNSTAGAASQVEEKPAQTQAKPAQTKPAQAKQTQAKQTQTKDSKQQQA
ncbi:MAG: ribosomal L7Ae/L30e/S12e/Gadd45 family protein [Candidatus Micrarchaeaceae archaeon]